MDRRAYLLALGALAGCSGGGSGSTPTRTPTATETATATATATPTASPTPEPTPTATPEPDAPTVLVVNLIESFEEYGDVQANEIESAPQGTNILIGYRYEVWIHQGTHDLTSQVEILDRDGNRVAINQDTDEQLTDGNGLQVWERALGFQASWEPAQYRAKVILRDNVTGKVSDPGWGTFGITPPEAKTRTPQ